MRSVKRTVFVGRVLPLLQGKDILLGVTQFTVPGPHPEGARGGLPVRSLPAQAQSEAA